MILHTRTHPSTRAENIDPKKGRLVPLKWLTSLKKLEFLQLQLEIKWGATSILTSGAMRPNPWLATVGC
jgi:hypothetical protein